MQCSVLKFLEYECYIGRDDLKTKLNERKLSNAQESLVGLKVRTTHYDKPRTYRVRGITELGADKLSFILQEEDGTKRKITVEQYFLLYIDYKLEFPKLNCLHVGNPDRNVYLPMEVNLLLFKVSFLSQSSF